MLLDAAGETSCMYRILSVWQGSLGTILNFQTKIGAGMGEKMPSREYYYLGTQLPMTASSHSIMVTLVFASTTCSLSNSQVVLGAGAMRFAGLQNITAKHLPLASQSLSIVIALMPYIRKTFRWHLPPKQAVMLVEFDNSGANEIHAKLIAIMGHRLAAHIKTEVSITGESRGQRLHGTASAKGEGHGYTRCCHATFPVEW
jgi:hypothetical protein